MATPWLTLAFSIQKERRDRTLGKQLVRHVPIHVCEVTSEVKAQVTASVQLECHGGLLSELCCDAEGFLIA